MVCGFIPPKHIIEKYLKPNGLPEHLIDEIPCGHYVGPGLTNRIFPKPVVEQFVEERRPKSLDKKSYGEEEGIKVSAANVIDVLKQIASALEQLATPVVPKPVSSAPEPEKGERVYTTREAAILLHRHPDVVREYCRKGLLGKRDASRKWVIRHREIESFREGRIMVHGQGAA